MRPSYSCHSSPVFFSQTKFNTSFNPLSTEVRCVEHRTVLPEEPLEHPREFLRQGQDERLAILDDAGGQVHFVLLPELTESRERAMPAQEAARLAQQWLRQNELWRLEGEDLKAGEVTTLTRQEFTPKGKAGEPIDALRTVHFIRELDGLRVFGPTSGLTVDVGDKGVLGVFSTLRPLVKGRRMPSML